VGRGGDDSRCMLAVLKQFRVPNFTSTSPTARPAAPNAWLLGKRIPGDP